VESFEKEILLFPSEHLSALRFNSRRLIVCSCCRKSLYIVYRAPFSYHLSTPKRKKGRRRQINV